MNCWFPKISFHAFTNGVERFQQLFFQTMEGLIGKQGLTVKILKLNTISLLSRENDCLETHSNCFAPGSRGVLITCVCIMTGSSLGLQKPSVYELYTATLGSVPKRP